MNKTLIDKSKLKLTNLLQEGLDNEIITKEHFTAMDPKAKNAAKFYMTFKVHKEHAHGETPPERPICSGSGTMLENACKFVEHYIKERGISHKNYLKDTPDFLRYVEHLNQTESFENSLIVTIDVIGLFTNIPEHDGIEAVKEALEERQDDKINREFLIRILEFILQNNIMEFNSQFYKQEIGAPMGQIQVPAYANNFMAKKIDPRILALAQKYTKHGKVPMEILKRCLDDFISIWKGTSKDLHKFLEDINQIHPNIKFTMKHTTNSLEVPEDRCDCTEEKSIAFLDTSLMIKNTKISVDLYKKPTDRNQYLLTNSIHPPDCLKNIPYSLALRITRMCTEKEDREKRYMELKEFLIERKYKPSLIDASI